MLDTDAIPPAAVGPGATGPAPAPVRVFLVDGYAIVREGIRRILASEPDIEVVGEAEGAEQALVLLDSLPADIVLLEMRLPGISGIEASRRIRASHPGIRVLVLAEQVDQAAEALLAGASGYFLKTVRSAELVAALRSIFLGATVIHGAVAESLGWGGGGRPAGRPRDLSQRETEVMQLVARGLSNRAIARALGIGSRTADQHVHSIFIKLGVRSRTEAVRYVLQHELAP